MLVLKTTSPILSPSAPNEVPSKATPSSRTSQAFRLRVAINHLPADDRIPHPPRQTPAVKRGIPRQIGGPLKGDPVFENEPGLPVTRRHKPPSRRRSYTAPSPSDASREKGYSAPDRRSPQRRPRLRERARPSGYASP